MAKKIGVDKLYVSRMTPCKYRLEYRCNHRLAKAVSKLVLHRLKREQANDQGQEEGSQVSEETREQAKFPTSQASRAGEGHSLNNSTTSANVFGTKWSPEPNYRVSSL